MAAGTSLSSSWASRVYCRFSRRRSTTITGSVMRITQAPSANFVMAITAATTKLRKQPKPLIATPLRQPGSRSRRWCLVMPACERVKPVNTPMA